jgi:hypothetical protein
MLKHALSFSAIIVMVLVISPTEATTVATVSTYAEYDTLSDSDNDSSTSPSVPAEAHTLVEYAPGGHYGTSDAEASITGVVKGFSEGFDSYGGPIFASSNASSNTDWLINSSTLPVGTSVNVLVDISFDGELYSEASKFESYANASFSVGGIELYQGSGRFARPNLIDDGYWAGDFQSAFSGYKRLLDTTDTLSFSALVGDIINIELTLYTEVDLVDVYEGGARADFFNSGSYTFVGAEDPLNPGTMLDVNFEVVPEPATLLLLGLGAVMVRRKRSAANLCLLRGF